MCLSIFFEPLISRRTFPDFCIYSCLSIFYFLLLIVVSPAQSFLVLFKTALIQDVSKMLGQSSGVSRHARNHGSFLGMGKRFVPFS